MKTNRILILGITVCLLFFALACEISLFPDTDADELTEAEVMMTNQAQLQTSVAQTVQALGPVEEPQAPAETAPEQADGQPSGPPTVTPLPCNKPKYQTETIPDNTSFDPGESFTKTWTVRNDGTCSWTTDYKLVFAGGDQMGGPASKYLLQTINPGESVTLSIDLTAPANEGTYTGTWVVQANDGEQFGNYWTTIIVGEPEEEPSETFAVTSVTFNNSDQMKVGFCPHSFNFLAEITVKGKGTVKYHWVISNGYEGPVESVTFNSAGTKTVTLNKNLSCSGTSTCSYAVQLYIDSPNHQAFGTWPIAIHCL